MYACGTPLVFTHVTSQLIQCNKELALLFRGEEHIVCRDWNLGITRKHADLVVVLRGLLRLSYEAQQFSLADLYHCLPEQPNQIPTQAFTEVDHSQLFDAPLAKERPYVNCAIVTPWSSLLESVDRQKCITRTEKRFPFQSGTAVCIFFKKMRSSRDGRYSIFFLKVSSRRANSESMLKIVLRPILRLKRPYIDLTMVDQNKIKLKKTLISTTQHISPWVICSKIFSNRN